MDLATGWMVNHVDGSWSSFPRPRVHAQRYGEHEGTSGKVRKFPESVRPLRHPDGPTTLDQHGSPWTCSPCHTCCAGQASFQICVKHGFHVVNHVSAIQLFRVLLPGELRHHVLKIGKINPNDLRILMGLVLFFASNPWKAIIQNSIYLPNIVPGPWSNCWG